MVNEPKQVHNEVLRTLLVGIAILGICVVGFTIHYEVTKAAYESALDSQALKEEKKREKRIEEFENFMKSMLAPKSN